MTIGDTVSIFKIPTAVILSWPPADYVHYHRRTWALPFCIAIAAVVTVIIALRIFARLTRRAGPFGLDDAVILVAWFVGLIFTGVIAYGVLRLGFDRHIWDVPFNLAVSATLNAWLQQLLIVWILAPTKISILLFYLRISNPSSTAAAYWVNWSAIVLTMAYAISSTIALCLICRPLDSYWTSMHFTSKQPYVCGDAIVLSEFISIFGPASDIFAMVIPAIVITRLKLAMRQKWLLYAVFCCGGLLTAATGIIRCIWNMRMFTDPRRDMSWLGFELAFLSQLEVQLGLACASAPALLGLATSFQRKRDIGREIGRIANSSTAKLESHSLRTYASAPGITSNSAEKEDSWTKATHYSATEPLPADDDAFDSVSDIEQRRERNNT